MYVAVKGGEAAISAAHELLARERRGDPHVPEITPEQIREQLTLAVNRTMCEGSLYDPELAALAVKQARGDLIEAIFLLRAYRTTLPRLGNAEPVDTAAMRIRRRISATYKDLPGGQLLGPTFDYTHRLLDAAPVPAREASETVAPDSAEEPVPHVTALLDREGLIESNAARIDGAPVGDITRDPVTFPASRDIRLQALARGDEGFLLALGYSTQRGYGRTHPFAGEIRMGEVEIELVPEELGFAVPLGRMTLTECEMVNQFKGSADAPPQFTRGYGLVFGHSERKAMAMALVDRALRTEELGQEATTPAQDQEFVLAHADNVQATGFVEHLKLPHYVDFQAELALLRQLRAEWQAAHAHRPVEDTCAEPQAGMEAAE
jgi:alpha-D-ribose 1-methylphosphonate 5-triphosphate synthase subunit PhnI